MPSVHGKLNSYFNLFWKDGLFLINDRKKIALNLRHGKPDILFDNQGNIYKNNPFYPVDIIFSSEGLKLFRIGSKLYEPNGNYHYEIKIYNDDFSLHTLRKNIELNKEYNFDEKSVIYSVSVNKQ